MNRDFRGRGVGRELLDAIIERAKAENYHVLIGGIDADNAVSIELHKRFGFTYCGEIREAGFKFGRWLHRGLLSVDSRYAGASGRWVRRIKTPGVIFVSTHAKITPGVGLARLRFLFQQMRQRCAGTWR